MGFFIRHVQTEGYASGRPLSIRKPQLYRFPAPTKKHTKNTMIDTHLTDRNNARGTRYPANTERGVIHALRCIRKYLGLHVVYFLNMLNNSNEMLSTDNFSVE